jgi:hypothetical protein
MFSSHSNKGDLFVQELSENDVLLGRGTGPNEHQGNIRFRALVKEILGTTNLPKHNGKAKTKLAIKIINVVKARKGRFLNKVSKSKTVAGDLYVVVPDSVALEKTKQSFRHQIRSLQLQVQATKTQSKLECEEKIMMPPHAQLPPENPPGNPLDVAWDLLKLRKNIHRPTPISSSFKGQGVQDALKRQEVVNSTMGSPVTRGRFYLAGITDPNPVPASTLIAPQAIAGPLLASNSSFLQANIARATPQYYDSPIGCSRSSIQDLMIQRMLLCANSSSQVPPARAFLTVPKHYLFDHPYGLSSSSSALLPRSAPLDSFYLDMVLRAKPISGKQD